MPLPRLIGLAGFARSGKTTLAELLSDSHTHMSFAEPIRDFTQRLFSDFFYDFILDRDKEVPCATLGGITPRQFMQKLGTEFGREMIHPDLWVARLIGVVAAHMDDPDGAVVVSDVRFPNEAKAIRELGGKIVWITRDGCGPSGHASEEGLPPDLIDGYVSNDGTPADMLESLRLAVACMESEVSYLDKQAWDSQG